MRAGVILGAVATATLVAAHPGANHNLELQRRNQFLANSRSVDLSPCAEKRRARGHEKRAQHRRRALAEKNAKRGFIPRDLSDLNKSHLSDADFGADTPLEDVFAANASCLLSPEQTEGPYYVTGEYIRTDVTEGQAGVPLTLDIDVFDTETCEPLTDRWVEIWHCNSTGVYSGVPSGGDFSSAPENLNNTFLRGFQQTDDIGAVQFQTTYPGHYTGRAIHVHVIVHTSNTTARDNSTIADTYTNHVGQLYFDQSLTEQVELNAPYNTNTQAVTLNTDDMWLNSVIDTSDPFVDYVLLGETAADGVLAWYSFGVNTSYVYSAANAATYYEGGGVANEGGFPGGGFPGGGGAPPGSGLPPSGTVPPTGTPTPPTRVV